jgi:predicted N-acyltransferase
MRLGTVESLHDIAAADWNRMSGDSSPFVRHEFLSALEISGCVGPGSGWAPQHMLAWHGDNGDARLVGAVPLYIKEHSYGEYVFDWAWANAYARAGASYYPKLVVAVPFTPATGPRILGSGDVADRLIDAVTEHAERSGVSSLHWLFTDSPTSARLSDHGLLTRIGHQYHWHNAGYGSFDDFLAAFPAQRRKKLKRERRRVAEAGIHMTQRHGGELEESDWDLFYEFYLSTIQRHGAIAYLNREFFHLLGRDMADSIVMSTAWHGDRIVAAALNLRGADTLYGRYWGCAADYHSLHFETCYYAPIEHCIGEGLARFEAGAQGEHKFSRGFVGVATRSAHWLRDPGFARAVADFLDHEQRGVNHYLGVLESQQPYKKAT